MTPTPRRLNLTIPQLTGLHDELLLMRADQIKAEAIIAQTVIVEGLWSGYLEHHTHEWLDQLKSGWDELRRLLEARTQGAVEDSATAPWPMPMPDLITQEGGEW